VTLQLMRSRTGKIRGVLVTLGKGRMESGSLEGKPWRICDECVQHEALVFCTTESRYVCEHCLSTHAHLSCHFLSIRAATEVATAALARVRRPEPKRVLQWR
jgi:hypothetical protein